MTTIPADAGRGGLKGRAISLDQLIALNDELAALVRAGVPLERGLLGVGSDFSGRLGGVITTLGERLSRGESLPQAMAAESAQFPPVYRAVVEAGLRAGRLSVALEELARFARSYAELRRAIGLALLYPLLVASMAYGLFTAFVILVTPRLVATFQGLQIPVSRFVKALSWLGEHAIYWAPVGPVVLLLLAVFWVATGRFAWLQRGRARGLIGYLPWMGSILQATEAANFAELLALLLDHQVPLAEAIELAAGASGDPALSQAAGPLAESSRRGEPFRATLTERCGLPPLLRWMMTTGQQQGTLVAALRHAATTYRRRALDRAELIRVVLPTILIFVIGASATILFALSLFYPVSILLYDLAAPGS